MMKQFTLRLPDDLNATLEKLAAANERSLNGQIVFMLRKQITADVEPPAAR